MLNKGEISEYNKKTTLIKTRILLLLLRTIFNEISISIYSINIYNKDIEYNIIY